MIIAVDFDNTIYNEVADQINYPLVEKLIEAKKNGHKLILWTCRGDRWLAEAIAICNDYGLYFDAVNENTKGFLYRDISVKVVADLYVDDKANGSIKYFMDNF